MVVYQISIGPVKRASAGDCAFGGGRGGLEHGVARALVASRVPRIFYVSCDPATLTRDLRELVRTYDVDSVRWFNMFPRTARFETLVTLRRKAT